MYTTQKKHFSTHHESIGEVGGAISESAREAMPTNSVEQAIAWLADKIPMNEAKADGGALEGFCALNPEVCTTLGMATAASLLAAVGAGSLVNPRKNIFVPPECNGSVPHPGCPDWQHTGGIVIPDPIPTVPGYAPYDGDQGRIYAGNPPENQANGWDTGHTQAPPGRGQMRPEGRPMVDPEWQDLIVYAKQKGHEPGSLENLDGWDPEGKRFAVYGCQTGGKSVEELAAMGIYSAGADFGTADSREVLMLSARKVRELTGLGPADSVSNIVIHLQSAIAKFRYQK